MDKKPNPMGSFGVVMATILLIVVGLVVVFLVSTQEGERQGITLPDGLAPEATTLVEPVEEQELFLTVEPENVQKVLQSMDAPSYYGQTLEVLTYWGDQSHSRTITVWRLGDVYKAEVLTASGTQHILVNESAVWIWYQGDRVAMERQRLPEMTLESLLGVPTYQTVEGLGVDEIVSAQYVPGVGTMPENCLEIVTVDEMEKITTYWVDATTQILVGAEEYVGDTLQLSVRQTALAMEQAAENRFVTPDGIWAISETDTPLW